MVMAKGVKRSVNKASKSVKSESEENEYRECDTNILLAEYEAINKLSSEEINTLQNLKVQLIHQVPPQHKIEKNAGSHVPSSEENRRFQKFADLKRGVYSPDEDKIICKNWKTFCKKHNWNRHNFKPFLYMRHGSMKIIRYLDERKKFVQFLANGLPNRTLYSVYHRFRNLFKSHLQSRYTRDEDEIILKHIEENPNVNPKHMHSDLAKVLNRTRASVWRRYQLLKKKKKEGF